MSMSFDCVGEAQLQWGWYWVGIIYNIYKTDMGNVR